ncbi:sugar kinase [Salipiger pallidus]|uniref:Sugar kinase n=1 Tax=Salipiger pallidus TaxID=1775170 RepID=A0A8J2ZIA9_9RHOB|nr:ROK family transcriptional regulator [Salipiger pallidus]GGG66527.1 sugar kinase [Salipiger pallidus]
MKIDLKQNHRRILDILRRKGPLPRIDLVELTSLQPGTLTRLSQDLIEMGLLEDVDFDAVPGVTSLSKRKTRLLRLDGRSLFTLGIVCTVDRTVMALSSLAGEVVAHLALDADMSDPFDVARAAGEKVDTLLETAGATRQQLVAAGVSVPINFHRSPERTFVPGRWTHWRGAAVREVFAEGLGLRTWIINDAHAAALAESYFGAGSTLESFNLVYLGYGIGGGNIIERRLYAGSFGNAAALGSYFPHGARRPSGQDLLDYAADRGLRVDSLFDLPEDLSRHIDLGPWIDWTCDQLHPVLELVKVMFDGEAIVIGGLLPPEVLQRLAERLEARTPAHMRETRYLASSLSRQEFHLAAASIPQFEITHPYAYKGQVVKGA